MMILKNNYNLLFIVALIIFTQQVYSQPDNKYSYNEKIKSVHNISVKDKRDINVNDNNDDNISRLVEYDAGSKSSQKTTLNGFIDNNENPILKSIIPKLGIRYVWGAEGPSGYDCSGFVYKVFNEIGFSIDRLTARTYWRKFRTARPDERYKLGTLVFFSNLKHVGIVLDENGFYHASKSKGITYSTFNSYWKKRIVGFKVIE